MQITTVSIKLGYNKILNILTLAQNYNNLLLLPFNKIFTIFDLILNTYRWLNMDKAYFFTSQEMQKLNNNGAISQLISYLFK